MGESEEEKPKKIKVKPEDFVTGREIAKPSEEVLISDDRIRQILARFAPILHKGIAEADSFFKRSIGERYTDAVPILEDEIELWNALFGLETQILKKAESGILFVSEVTANDSELLSSSEKPEPSTHTKALRVKRGEGKRFRVNLGSVAYVPILPFDPEGMRFFIKPHAHLGGRGKRYGVGDLYNAFMKIDIYVQDSFGRWVIKQIPGTGTSHLSKEPVYSPLRPLRVDVWFNTSIKPDKQNSLSISVDKTDHLMLHCDIHQPRKLNELEIPDDPRLKFFFWQLDRFMKPVSIGDQQRPALLSGE